MSDFQQHLEEQKLVVDDFCQALEPYVTAPRIMEVFRALYSAQLRNSSIETVKWVMEEVEKKGGITSDPDYWIRLKHRLRGNIVMKSVDDFQVTQIAWEAKDLFIDDLISELNKVIE